MASQSDINPGLGGAILGGGLVLLAWGLWALVRRWDRENAILAAAPPLPIRLLEIHDDAWVRGEILCPRPLGVPFFNIAAVHFSYTLEERVLQTYRDSNGRMQTRYVWEIRDQSGGTVPFAVVEDGHQLLIDVAKARFVNLFTACEQVGDWRHTARFLPAQGEVSVVGVVEEADGRRLFTQVRHVPLIVTPRLRADYLARSEWWERLVYRIGLIILALGFFLVFFGIGVALLLPQYGEPELWPGDLLAVVFVMATALSLLVVTSLWAVRTYNNLVTFRVRIEKLWSSLDVELKQRFEVVPNLVAVVKACARHEREVFESLARLRQLTARGPRAERVAREGQIVAGIRKLLALREAYPQLKANDLFLKLSDQLTALEDKIAHARSVYNDAVAEFNREAMQFPSRLVARWTGFSAYPLFAADLKEKATPTVQMTASASGQAVSRKTGSAREPQSGR